MKTKIFLLSLCVAAMGLISCNPGVSSEKEKELINVFYQSLDTTPDLFTARMSQFGLSINNQSSKGIGYVNKHDDYDDQLTVGVHFDGNQINRIIYERYLNKESNVAAYYKLFSDMIADHGYTDWQGFYKDPAERSDISAVRWEDYSSVNIAENRQKLCDHVINENLSRIQTWQYFVETFVYTHSDNSQWEGRIFVYTDQYFSGMIDDDFEQGYRKDIFLQFKLERIEK